MVREYSVKLEIKNGCVRGQLIDIINSTGDFYICPDTARDPDLCIMDVEDPSDQGLQVINSYLAANPAAEIFLTSSQTRSEVLLKALKLGVKEFFLQPLDEEEVHSALGKLKARLEEKSPSKKNSQGRIISVMGAKGGCGSTTVAINTAICLARATQANIALVDLDMERGASRIFLGMENPYSIADIAGDIDRLDDTLLMSVLSKHPSGIYALHPPEGIEQASIQPGHAQKTIELMRDMFGFIVVDSGCLASTAASEALGMADDILLVITLELHAVYNARKYLQALADMGGKVKLVFNRYRKSDYSLLKEAEKALGKRHYWLISNNYHAAISAINQGRAIVELSPTSGIAHDLEGLALKLNGLKRPNKCRPFNYFLNLFAGNGSR